MISANVFTYTAPPNSPSQNTMMKTIQTDGRKKNIEWSSRKRRLRICRMEGRYKEWMRRKGVEEREMKTPSW
jgi:hypothetical protein